MSLSLGLYYMPYGLLYKPYSLNTTPEKRITMGCWVGRKGAIIITAFYTNILLVCFFYFFDFSADNGCAGGERLFAALELLAGDNGSFIKTKCW
jgi:hypothetical protein